MKPTTPSVLAVNGGSSSIKFALFEADGAPRRILEAKIDEIGLRKKWIGAFAAALGGLDPLVFSGGIGEHAALIRARACDGLGFLGLELDQQRNLANEGVISAESSRVVVRVIPTDEEWMIARTVCRILGYTVDKERDYEKASH